MLGSAHTLSPRRLEVAHDELLVEGHRLEKLVLAGHAFGAELGAGSPVVIVGGITASPFPFGDDGSVEAWWPSLRAADLVDPDTQPVLCPAWPGNGSTFAGFDDGSAPALSALGLADLVAAWLDGIGCRTPVTFIGASLGGLVGVAFAARYPERCARLVTISAGLRPDGWGTATRHLQRELVRDGLRTGDVATGMTRARQLGMLTYRGRDELDTRFGPLAPGAAVPPVASYLEHHGRRFAASFPVRTFLFLSEAIDRSRFGDTAASVREVLGKITAEVLVIGVPGDMLFPWALQHELHRTLQALGATSSLWKLDSEFGHDAFLADQARLAGILRDSGFFQRQGVAQPARWEGVGHGPVRELRIGLVGCGVVGQGLLQLIETQKDAMLERYRVRFRVVRIAVRDEAKDRGALAAAIPKTTRPLDLVADPEVDVIVEVAGGLALEPVVSAALAAGKPVVTANKALLARKLAQLGVLAQRTGTPLLCEASAAAALPIIRHLSHRADEVDSLLGIVNGTCNYIITRLEQDELPMDEAIAEAQRLGFAEADPSADLDGLDAAAKLSILAYRAFGIWLPPDAFPVRGIRELEPADCDLAETLGFRVRLIAHAARIGDGLSAAVEPVLLPAWHLVASVEEEYNAVYLRSPAAGDLGLFGKGAGALPTATAVLGDLIDLAQDNSVAWPEPRKVHAPTESPPRRHYLRVSAEPHTGLARRVDSLVRRAGLTVQNRAERSSRGGPARPPAPAGTPRPAGVWRAAPSSGGARRASPHRAPTARSSESHLQHLGFLLSPSTDAQALELAVQLARLERVERHLCLGVLE